MDISWIIWAGFCLSLWTNYVLLGGIFYRMHEAWIRDYQYLEDDLLVMIVKVVIWPFYVYKLIQEKRKSE